MADGEVQGDVRKLRQMMAECEPYLKEGETPAQRIERERRDTDAVLNLLVREKQRAEAAAAEIASLRAALRWYADGEHFDRCDPDAWDTVSGEPQNWWCDEAGAGMVEDGTLAAKVLAGELTGEQLHALDE